MLQQFFKKPTACESCGTSSRQHMRAWIHELAGCFLAVMPDIRLPQSLNRCITRAIENLCIFFGIIRLESHFTKEDIPIRTYCFMEEGKKRGMTFQAFRGPWGFMNYFRMRVNGKTFSFEGLPVADFANTCSFSDIDDKAKTKKKLLQGNFPVLQSKAFWFFQQHAALQYGERIRYPLVVKPRNGSYSRHTTTNILNKDQLKAAISSALEYSPTFVVETFFTGGSVFRATVVDMRHVACVQRTPANVIGDGIHTIQALIDKKNADPDRGNPDQESYTLFKIADDATAAALLREQGYEKHTVLPRGIRAFLQHDPFIRLGADSDEVTDQVHPDTMALFKDIARYFDIRVVGLDFLCTDITVSWKDQPCAVLELNSLPCIEVHHFPSSGAPQNVAGRIVDIVYDYYLA